MRVITALAAAFWLISTGLLVSAFMQSAQGVSVFTQLGAVGFVVVLSIALWQGRNFDADLPPVAIGPLHNLAFLAKLAVVAVVLALCFALGALFHPWIVLVVALAIIAAAIVVQARERVTWQMIVASICLGALCLSLAWASGRLDVFQGLYLTCVPILFVGGALLASRTQLARVHLADGAWWKAIAGFAWGCLLSVPAALLNVSFGAHSGDDWIDKAWEPAVALVPGIGEETWARLFLLTLLYAVLATKPAHRPKRAVAIAVLVAALVHGFAHLTSAQLFPPAALQMAVAALLFGVPMGLVYVRYGWEAAVGYHTFVDFMRFFVALQQQ